MIAAKLPTVGRRTCVKPSGFVDLEAEISDEILPHVIRDDRRRG
jgi:hypothetical protein